MNENSITTAHLPPVFITGRPAMHQNGTQLKMKITLLAMITLVALTPCAQASTAHIHPAPPSIYEQISNRCMYIAASGVPKDSNENDVTQAALLCINGAEHAITTGVASDEYQRLTLAANVEEATTQEDADHAQVFLDAYDAGQLIGRDYDDENVQGGKKE